MKFKIKNLTLLTLLVTAIPFISFSPIWSADGLAEAVGEDSAFGMDDDGSFTEDGEKISIDDVPEEVLTEFADAAGISVGDLKEEGLTPEQIDKVKGMKIKEVKSAEGAEATFQRLSNPDGSPSTTTVDSDLGAGGSTGASGEGDGNLFTDNDGGEHTTQSARDRTNQEIKTKEDIAEHDRLKEEKSGLKSEKKSLEKQIKAEQARLEKGEGTTFKINEDGSTEGTSGERDRLLKQLDNVNDRLDTIDDDIRANNDELTKSPEGREILRKEGVTSQWHERLGDRVLNTRLMDKSGDFLDRKFTSQAQLDRIQARDVELQGKLDTANDELHELRMQEPPDEDAIKEKEEEIASLEKARRQNATLKRRFARGVKSFVKGTASIIRMVVSGFAMLIAQALAFTVPSALYQMTVAKEDRMALMETISDVQPFGKLFLQIPPQLINKENPTDSAYLYCEVPSNQKQGAGYFNSSFLKTANFYVTGAPQESFWGTSYIGGSQFNGQMVCLNNGFVFVGEGEPANAQSPTTAMVPTIEEFASGFVTKTSANTFHHTADATDWIRMDASSLMAKGAGNTFNDPVIKSMLLSPQVSQYAATGSSSKTDNLPGTAGGEAPPPLFYTTISKFRTPVTVNGFGGLQLKQMQGTGFLNILLDNSIDTSSPSLKTALKQLSEADANKTKSGNAVSGYGKAEVDNLRAAQNKVAAALSEQQVDTTQYGFSPDGNINAQNLYVYEIVAEHAHGGTMTPSLHGLLKNQPNTYIPLTEYVVCLGADGRSIVPLLKPQIIPNNIGSTGKGKEKQDGYTLQMEFNEDITYVTSLTTGLSYEKGADQGTQTVTNAKGQKMSPVKLLTPYMDSNGSPDFSMAINALQVIEGQLSQTGAIGDGALNQIMAMANKTTDAAIDGPFTTYTGYTLKRVPLLELLDGDPVEQEDRNIKAMGDVLSNASSMATQNAAYTSWNEEEKRQYLSKFYIYKVTKGEAGALSADIPDYVVPVGGATTGKFQILPLGTDQIMGGLSTNGVQGLFSLITGKGTDTDYEPLPLWYTVNMHPLNRGSYFPLTGEGKYGYQAGTWAGQQETTIYVDEKNARGEMVRVKKVIRTVPDVYMGTAFMPEQYNPANRIITNGSAAEKYDAARSNVIRYGLQFQKITTGMQGLSAGTKELGFKLIDQYGAAAAKKLVTAGFNEEQAEALMAARSADSIESNLEQAMTNFNNLNKMINTNRNDAGQLFNPSLTAWKNRDLVLSVPPLYFLFFTGFSFCSEDGQSFPAFPPTRGSADTSSQSQKIRWPMTKPCQNASPLTIKHNTGNVNGSLMSVLPQTFSGFDLAQDLSESSQVQGPLKQPLYFKGVRAKTRNGKYGKYYHSILATYTEWALTQDRTNYWAQTGFLGPFNFTQRQYGNVYITATSRADVANGNFFYHASGFSPSDIFVCAAGPVDGNVTTLSQLRDVGKPYANLVEGNYLINVGTGQLYTPYIYPGTRSMEGMQSSAPYVCFSGQTLNNECSLQPVGQSVLPGGLEPARGKVPPATRTGTQVRFNPQDVLALALSNQRDIGQRVSPQSGLQFALSTLSYSLQKEISTAMQSAEQQIQKSLYPIYFGGLKLRLSEQSVTNGTYIYAVTPQGESYEEAQDYLVVAEMPDGSLQSFGAQAVTPYTNIMLSLVTGTVYNVNGQSKQNFMGKEYAVTGVGREQNVPTRLMGLMQATTKVKINPGLVKRIIDLNTLYLKQARSLQDSSSLLNNAPVLSIQSLEQARGVTEPGLDESMPTANLIELSGKYFLKVKSVVSGSGAGGKGQTLYTLFDFNGTNERADANVGIRYTMPENPKAENFIPTSAVTGFELEAMRAAHGVVVEPNGEQAVTIPVTNIALPLGRGEKTLVPNFGQDGEYMILAKHIPPRIDREKGEKYYYYYHRVTQAYYVLIQDLVGMRYGGGQGDGAEEVAEIGYFVDLMSGDEYYVNGHPRMTPTTVAYPIIKNSRKEEAVNVEAPIFTWGIANNVPGGGTLNVMANAGNGYTQYQYVPFTTVYRFKNKDETQTMLIGYEITGAGANQQIIPMRKISSGNSQEAQTEKLNAPGNTAGLSPQQVAEIAFTAAVEGSAQSGWSLYEIEYKVSPSGLAYGSVPFTEAPGEAPKRYQFGDTQYLEGGIKRFNYPLAESNTLNQALAKGRSFVSIGMGNRQGTRGIPQGTAAFGTTLCGVMDAGEEAMIGFVPTVNSNSSASFYLIGQDGLPRPGQKATYQSANVSIPGLVTNYSVTGQKSPSGLAMQSSYVALQANQDVQSIYGFDYSYASNKALENLKSNVNVLSNAEGHIQLVQSLDIRSKTGVNIPRGSIGNYLTGFTSPLPTVIYTIPPLHVAERYFENDNAQYDSGDGNTMSTVEMFNNMISTFGVGTYVNYYNGAIFEIKKDDPNYLYPNGFSVSAQALSLIRKQFRGATVEAGSLDLMLPGAVNTAINRAMGSNRPPTAPGSSSGSGRRRPPTAPGSNRQGPPAPRSNSGYVNNQRESYSETQQGSEQLEGPPQRSSRRIAPPPPRSRQGGYSTPQQSMREAFVDLKNKALSIMPKFFGGHNVA